MSEWEIVQDNQSQSSIPTSDWEMVQSEPLSRQPQTQEGLGAASVKAPFRIGEDILRGGMNFLRNIPGYYEAAKTEVPGVRDVLNQHPLHALKQAGAGLTELGHNLLNLPRGLADYSANRLNLISPETAQRVPYQRDISNEINQAFGAPEYPGEALIRGGARNALNLMAGGKIASALNPMNLTAKSIAKDILKTGEQNKKIYSKRYNDFWKEAEKEGLGDALYNINIDMNALRKYSPEKSIRGVIDFNNEPTLRNAHAAKSDLLRIERDLNKLPTLRTAERKQLNAAKEAINSLNENMFKHSNGSINENLLNKYNQIQQGYAKEVVPYKNKAINQYKRNEISAKELVNALSRGEFRAKRGSAHPEMSFRGKAPYVYGGLAGAIGAPSIYEYLFGNKMQE